MGKKSIAAIFCDICGEDLTTRQNYGAVRLKETHKLPVNVIVKIEGLETTDLCPICFYDIVMAAAEEVKRINKHGFK